MPEGRRRSWKHLVQDLRSLCEDLSHRRGWEDSLVVRAYSLEDQIVTLYSDLNTAEMEDGIDEEVKLPQPETPVNITIKETSLREIIANDPGPKPEARWVVDRLAPDGTTWLFVTTFPGTVSITDLGDHAKNHIGVHFYLTENGHVFEGMDITGTQVPHKEALLMGERDRLCHYCGEHTSDTDDAVLLEIASGYANNAALFVGVARHIFPRTRCPGSPSRAQYFLGQKPDNRTNRFGELMYPIRNEVKARYRQGMALLEEGNFWETKRDDKNEGEEVFRPPKPPNP